MLFLQFKQKKLFTSPSSAWEWIESICIDFTFTWKPRKVWNHSINSKKYILSQHYLNFYTKSQISTEDTSKRETIY